MYRSLLFLSLALLPGLPYAQPPADAEEAQLARTLDIPQRIALLNQYARKYYASQPEKALRYAEEALRFSDQTGNPPGRAGAWMYGGFAQVRLGEARKGVKMMEDALAYYQARKDTLPWMELCKELSDAAKARGDQRATEKYRKEYLSLRIDIVNRDMQQQLSQSEKKFEAERQLAESAQAQAESALVENERMLQAIEEKDAAYLLQQLEMSRLQEDSARLALASSELERENLSREIELRKARTRSNFLIGGLVLLALLAGGIYQRFRLVEARRLAEIEKQRAERLRQVDQLKDQFLANTSHELRTPLNGIIGIAEALEEHAHDDFERENLALVVSSGKRLAALINDLLDFSRLRNSDLALEARPVDLRTAASIVIQTSLPLLGNKPVNVENDIYDFLPPALADENRLQQIFYNLIGNAIKFTERGQILVSARREGEMLRISVKDTGIGISPERQQTIFEAFEQGDGSITRSYGGTGLGLSITRKLVELHGGSIGVESQPGKGSEFYFTLPLSHAPAAAPAPSAASLAISRPLVPAGAASASLPSLNGNGRAEGKVRVLIVDDEPINQQVLRNHLGNSHFHAVSAMNGAEALDLLDREGPFDIVLLDIMMPRMSGYEVCRRIRERYLPSELPVIMVTAKNDVADLVEGFSTGANDYIGKPFSRDEFLARLRTHLQLHTINAITEKFVPAEFLHSLGYEHITEVRLGDQVERSGTVLFSDIRGYTTLAEKLTPAETFTFLNEYLGQMGPLVQSCNGFVNQYLGDGIMALFLGNPGDALQAAIAMQHNVLEMNHRGRAPGGGRVSIGIGMHSGSLMMGVIGDAHRLDAGLVADTVNTAARVEGLTKAYGAKILLSETVYQQLSDPKAYRLRYLGQIQVKGRSAPLGMYECLDGYEPAIAQRFVETLPQFDEALQLYLRQQFAWAADAFASICMQNPHDLAARRFEARAKYWLEAGVPEGWKGVDEMAEK